MIEKNALNAQSANQMERNIRLNNVFERWKKLIEHIHVIQESELQPKVLDLLTDLQNGIASNYEGQADWEDESAERRKIM